MRCPAYALIDRPRRPTKAVPPVTDVAVDGAAAAAAGHPHSSRTESIFRQLPGPPEIQDGHRVDRDAAGDDAVAAEDDGVVVVVAAADVLGSTWRAAGSVPSRDPEKPAGGHRRFG